MALTNTTTTTALIPTLVEAKVTEAAGRFRTFRNVYSQYARSVTGPGKSGNIAQLPQLTLASRTESTEPTGTAFTPTPRTFTLATYGLHLDPSWESMTFTQGDLTANIGKALANAWAALEDGASTGFAGLYAEASTTAPDHTIGGTTQVMDLAFILQANALLDAQYAPYPRSLFVNSICYGHLMNNADLRTSLAQTKGNQPQAIGQIDPRRYLGNLLGIDVYKVDDLITTGGNLLHNLLIADGAVGIYYAPISTPLSPVPSEFNVDVQYSGGKFGWSIDCEVIHDVCSFASQGTTTSYLNNWLVDMGTKTT